MSTDFSGIIPPSSPASTRKAGWTKARQREIVRYLSNHVQGFYPCGTYGSGPHEHPGEETGSRNRNQGKGKAFVIVHVGAAGTADAVDLARHAEAAGADAVGAILPYYYAYSQDQLLGYYRAIIKAVKIPVFVYNNPNSP
ncbi:MAG: dihydrodipicolinate synthase family protein [Chromatiales bacterium]|nr:dihydrodipicolinate synthase family protein [Chromatiales bacterium]